MGRNWKDILSTFGRKSCCLRKGVCGYDSKERETDTALYEGGRASHIVLGFAVEHNNCSKRKASSISPVRITAQRAEVMKITVSLVIHECSMYPKLLSQILDNLLKGFRNYTKSVGRMALVMAGEGMQLLPVVP